MTKRKQQAGFSQRKLAESRGKQAAAQRLALIRMAIVAAMVVVFVVTLTIFVRNWSPVVETAAGGTVMTGERPLAGVSTAERNDYYSSAPLFDLDTSKSYEAVITTSKGEMRLRLFDDQAPLAVNNFIFLANQGFFDGTTFHRVLENFMAQGGDPTGTGTGGPGYRFADEIVPELTFNKRGLLAMANAGPGTNGSQFFITFTATPWLDGNHTIFGELITGDEVLSALRLRNPETDPQPGDVIERVEIVVK